jgi:hypothetical protein
MDNNLIAFGKGLCVDTPQPKRMRILGSTSPLRLGSLRYLTQRWFSPQALTSGMPYRSCIAAKFVFCLMLVV